MSQLGKPAHAELPVSKASGLVREPVLLANLIGALLLEVCILLRQFGVPLTDGQVDAINAVAGLLLLIAAALLGRKFVTPLGDPRDHTGQSLAPNVSVAAAPIDSKAAHEAGQVAADAPPLPPIEESVENELRTHSPRKPRKGDAGTIGGPGAKS